MAQVINTNIPSLMTQNNLSKSQANLSTALQRLSSGLRINSAKDDAAGLAISERMTAQINGLDQAVRNANDGISLAQTAESAMSTMGDNLQRLRQLAVQAANATNSTDDRNAIQKEVNNLVSELQRTATQTQFNGSNILDGSFGTANFQVGANANQTIQVTTNNFQTTQYGDYRVTGNASNIKSATGAGPVNTDSNIVTGNMAINGYLGSTTVGVTQGDSAATIAANVNKVKGSTGVSASAQTSGALSFALSGQYTLKIGAGDTVANAAAGAQTVSFSLTSASGNGLSQAVDAINALTSKTGVTASISTSGDSVVLNQANGNTITVQDTAATNAGNVSVGSVNAAGAFTPSAPATTLTANTTPDAAVIEGQVTFDSSKSFSAQGSAEKVTSGGAADTASLLAVSTLDVTSFSNATKALAIIDSAISQVSDQRAQFGAVQNRFTATVSNLQTVSQNTSAARSRILDTDFAAETANLTKSQILQQAGTAMLAQANQLPQGVLSLLR